MRGRAASLLLVHGSGSGSWVFEAWDDAFPGLVVARCDLQAGLDVAHATMRDYAAAVARDAEPLPRPLAICAWSLGGLAAMLAAETVRPEALILLEASTPLELQGLRDVTPAPGTFDPVAAGGRFPPGMRSRPESSLAMGERDRGVSVPALPPGTRALCVFGDEYRLERGTRFAAFYGADTLDAGHATHWDLVLDPAVRSRIADWLRAPA